jgi:hypothetical protein
MTVYGQVNIGYRRTATHISAGHSHFLSSYFNSFSTKIQSLYCMLYLPI